MKWQGFHRQADLNISGDLLVADFHSSVANLVTREVASAEAQRSEEEITAALQYAGGGSGTLLSPQNIAPETADNLMKSSVDAHVKKVQAAQIKHFANQQVSQLQAEDLRKYKGRKVRISRIGNEKDTFQSLWLDKYTGQLQPSSLTAHNISGVIEDLSFEQNTLVLLPSMSSRIINPGRKYYIVQVISMTTMQPAVQIDLV